ncbi:MAG TPA: hypothetical protein VKD71_13075 [Gemmataceae bacterium]|nr:hypothetical protein [Gemmataceae bacterium]
MRKHLWLSIIAVGMLTYGVHCLRQAPAMRQAIENLPEMTCEQLVREDPDNNRYVVLTDVALSSGRSVSQQDGETGALELYHPIYSAASAKEPAALQLRLILGVLDETDRRRVRDDRNERQADGRAGLSRLTVELKTTGDRLPDWAQKGLADKYPGIPLGQCYVVTIGGDEPTAAHAKGLQWRGVGLAILGVIILGWCAWDIRVQLRAEPSAGSIKAPPAVPAANSQSADAPSRLPAGSVG